MKIEIQKYKLDFRFEAGTSRGVMTSKNSYFLKLYDQDNPQVFGIGECSPLVGLSPDLEGNLQEVFQHCITSISRIDHIKTDEINDIIPETYPALKFALETAILDLKKGGTRVLFENEFTNSTMAIPVNGLVWMGNRDLMRHRIKNKLDEGFDTIKIKVGAINIEDEIALLKYIRNQFSSGQITIRLDANGAFHANDALGVLDRFSKYDIHSIEQPIMAGDWKEMEKICDQSPIPIALDEEIIGIYKKKLRKQLLKSIKPAYIIIKPTLLGGFQQSKDWIELAKDRSIGWWMTSALESNIGLNAISQFTINYPISLPHGLGTGQLFHNNIPSPLRIKDGYLLYDQKESWNLSDLD